MSEFHRRTCHICEANCGIIVETEGRKVLSIKGNPDHVLSGGYICPKATAIADIQEDPDRLRAPLKRDGDEWREISWDTAFSEIAARVAKVTAGEKRAALYLGNPTAHNYGVTTQIKGLFKALRVQGLYSASTLDQLPHMVVQKWVYGHSSLYPVADIDRTNYMLIVGGNPAASNGSLWTVPNVRKRMKDLRERGGKLVVVDPRRTETAKLADEHHFIKPSGDVAFLVALLLVLDEEDLVNPGRLKPFLDDGWDESWTALRQFEIADLAAYCGIDETAIREIARELGSGQPAIVYGRMGVSVQRFGTVNHWLIQLLNIATGNVDREGGTMFGVPLVDAVETSRGGTYGRFHSRVSNRPEVLGELPAGELAEDITAPGEGQIGALFTIAGNPVLSAPGGRQLDDALETLDLMVSIDMYVTETSRHADYILPPCGPLEKDHYPLLLAIIAVRNFACYSPATFEKEEGTLSDWEIVQRLAQAIMAESGDNGPAPVTPRDALSAMIEGSHYGLTLEDLDAAPDGIDLGALTPQLPERLKTENKVIHCAPDKCLEDLQTLHELLKEARTADFLLIGRRHIRSNNSWLHNHRRLIKGPNRCTLMINPRDAETLNLADGDLASVSNKVGAVELPVEITDDVMEGVVSIPHGYGHGREGVKLSLAAEHAGVSLNDLTDPSQMDPLSGNAVLNGTPVDVRAAAT